METITPLETGEFIAVVGQSFHLPCSRRLMSASLVLALRLHRIWLAGRIRGNKPDV